MKSIREIHEDEQREAALAEATKVFFATMKKLNDDHDKTIRRLERADKIVTWSAIGFLFVYISAMFGIVILKGWHQ